MALQFYVCYGKNLSQTELQVYYLGMVTDHVSYIDLNLNVFSFVVFNWILKATVFPVVGQCHALDGIAGSFYVKCYFSEDKVVELT